MSDKVPEVIRAAIMPNKRSPFSRNVWLTAGLFVILIIVFVIYTLSEKQTDLANDLRYQSFLLADELRQSSDDLTRMVRTVVYKNGTIMHICFKNDVKGVK